jgi:hypothetical protein
MSTTDSSLADPFARFRSSMGASATDHPSHASGHHSVGRTSRATSRSPDPNDFLALDEDSDEDGSQLLRLIDEATHATTHLDGSNGIHEGGGGVQSHRDPGASFVVTANASMSSFAHSTTHSTVFGTPPPLSPPTFVETVNTANRLKTPGTGPIAAVNQPGSPPPFGMMSHSIHQASSSTTSVHTGHHPAGGTPHQPPPPPPPPGGPLETMVVRNHRGVFLLNPAGKPSMSHPNTPPYAPPQYASAAGASPPVSPLPSYALPPPVPPMNSSIGHSVHGGSPVANSTPPPAHPGNPPGKQVAHGQSPPSYPAPPPYRSPSAKGAATGGGSA